MALSWSWPYLWLPKTESERLPFYGNILWAVLYVVMGWVFWAASSPFARQSRKAWTVYGVCYNLLVLWVSAGLIGHSPFFRQLIEFDVDEPASLLFPLFWAGLAVLLAFDFVHYRAQLYLRQQTKCGTFLAGWAYDSIRTKFNISFARSFGEASLNSFAAAAICVLVHTSLVDTTDRNKHWGWDTYVLVPNDHALRINNYLSNISISHGSSWVPSSKVSGIWLTFMCILIIQHWMERVAHVRGIFQDDESDQEPLTAETIRRRQSDSVVSLNAPVSSPRQRGQHRKQPLRRRFSSASSTSSGTKDWRHLVEPAHKKEMAAWWDYALTQTAIDVFISLNIFTGRFDRRQLLANNHSEGRQGGVASDPFEFDHSRDKHGKPKEEMWFDFMADCGDGFDSSYAISRLLAQPKLALDAIDGEGKVCLPRGELLIIGGDLAYPRPTNENFEQRFLRVFNDAMPSPYYASPYHEEHVSMGKPVGRKYAGPVAYLIPGNHDWYDGLASFMKYILYRDWMGGWLLPQTKSYFVLRLPHDWFVFGFDNGLDNDIDPQQAAYFANYSKTLPEAAKVILIQHDPNWVLDQYEARDRPQKKRTGKRIEFLMNAVLPGKVFLRLAGDVHNYMRHIPLVAGGGLADQPPVKIAHEPVSNPTLVVSGGGGAFLHPTHCLGEDILEGVAGTNDQNYVRAAAYPKADVSAELSWLNLTKFRVRNWRFDVIGGLTYLLLAHPLFADCTVENSHSLEAVKNANVWYVFVSFLQDSAVAVGVMVSSSKLALFVALCLWLVTVNAVDSGKVGLKFVVGTLHCASHILCAAAVNVAIDWLFLSFAAHGTLGQNDLETQWSKFQVRFPDGAKWLDIAGGWTFGLVPAVMRYSMLIADSPNTQVYIRNEMYCRASNCADHAGRSDLVVLYWILRACWYWVLSCFFVSIIVPAYLWICLNYLGLHWNEGFSSLQHTGYKNFVRMKITKEGKLELYTVGIDKVPSEWVLDPDFVKAASSEVELVGGEGDMSYEWPQPSRWKAKQTGRQEDDSQNMGAKLVDRVVLN